ncbi:hypothetical protein [Streptomyces cavernicola]|uniref:Uncharacterized protein n=1 Tax=Streptomyces cavernicola TaxID=3043613 RepID=A0ABT6SQ33_9ACTN|nr:hypothetical protein [Streptomyces sp. B-S-A6]MDI3409346.1 hypothetical protein [Streptomyces sp. B-S-A6]
MLYGTSPSRVARTTCRPVGSAGTTSRVPASRRARRTSHPANSREISRKGGMLAAVTSRACRRPVAVVLPVNPVTPTQRAARQAAAIGPETMLFAYG